MSPLSGDTPVVDHPDESRLTLDEDGRVAELIYRRVGDRLILVHTGVPDALSGRGIGGRLVRAGVELAASDHLVVQALCPFARNWLREHPEVTGTVAMDWSRPPSASS
jgi:uncharacterized protein